VNPDPPATARIWAHELPHEFAWRLAGALRDGRRALKQLKGQAALPASTAAVEVALQFERRGDGPYAGGLLAGHLRELADQPHIVPVWTGPESDPGSGRLTLAVVADLIGQAQREILLATYATVPGEDIRQALHAAASRGVEITLLLERAEDNPGFRGLGNPFPGLTARRLTWPREARPAEASMHAKILVVDRRIALVGSANLTGHALERNLECGLLIRGGPVPSQLVAHLLGADSLREAH
jgi:cardiolipin synthase A/B